jgi:DNA-binding XRE family transcriptional regulator
MPNAPHLRSKGDAIKARRLRMFLTHDELADIANVSPTTLKAWEKGTGPIRLHTVRKIAKALGCDPADISTVYVPDETEDVA